MTGPGSNRVLFAAAASGIAIYGIAFAVLGVMLGMPEMKARLHTDPSHTGLIFLFLYTGVFVSNVFVGPLLEWLGKRPVMSASAVVVGLSLISFSTVHSVVAASVAAAMLGIGGGALNVTVNALVSELFPAARTSMLNLLGVFFGVGAVSVPLSAAALLSHIGISQLFIASSSFPMAAAVFYLTLRFPKQQETRGIPLFDGIRVLGLPGVPRIGLLLFFENANEAVIAAWTSIYAVYIGCTSHATTLLIAAYWASLMFGRSFAALIGKRTGKLTIILTAASGAMVGCGLLFTARSAAALCASVILVGFSFAPIFKTALSIAGDRHPAETAPIFGVLFAISLLGAMAAPWLVGQISQRFSLRYAPIVPILGTAFVIVMTLLVRHYDLGPNTAEERSLQP